MCKFEGDEVILTKYAPKAGGIIRFSENCMETVRIIMIHFNDTKTFSEAF